MRKLRRAAASLLTITIISGCTLLYASLPSKIHFQGQITKLNGNPVAGTVNMTFKIYNALTGDAVLKTLANVGVLFNANGVFVVDLDLSGLDLDQSLWLGMTIGTDEEMSPRAPILPSATSSNSSSTLAVKL